MKTLLIISVVLFFSGCTDENVKIEKTPKNVTSRIRVVEQANIGLDSYQILKIDSMEFLSMEAPSGCAIVQMKKQWRNNEEP